MSPAASPSATETALVRLFERLDAVHVDVPLLQPAEPYLDSTGEALRRRIFLTRGEAGEVLCLRPDFTIPVCLAHIAAPSALPRRYSYLGPIFRQGRAGEGEFRQAGLEDLGDPDKAKADARALLATLEALAACGLANVETDVVLGDQALFEAFLAGLGLPESWQRRLVRTFGDDVLMRAALADLAQHDGWSLAGLDPALRRLAAGKDVDALIEAVEGLKAEGGLPPHSGRTAPEIAQRLVEKVAFAETALSEDSLSRLREFLAIDCTLDDAPARLAHACGADIDLGRSLAFFAERAQALAEAGVDLSAVRYRAAFGRAIDYYTGLVFEARRPGVPEPLAGGGRYDRLLAYLGAKSPVPAVGVSLWLDRIEAAAR
ncbi:ATP phosphoribosyltransferase regulatory subunit [Aureimonas leprariae]|uniref:ATP phosphoribosyltransferase regulatory subunit n=1 Tax=Plantimonas leprariae TaxID=2615207 RepID=A0A7V7TUF0_9HYPH|nr:ATP phosphoribosyltransferase regulatory subunit [Aureimonas leprariae]KAB0675823.1 ATP phosphoribosyltransferase regulatory subunit [Aureimonas leprariae]